jgi:rare lipoprotein A (peptidoglycan hydrolase)
MACGDKLTHRTLGVAHKRLPCGTKVALRYRGRTIVVPVIDRGPYSRGVSYDLTEATARKLGMSQTSRVGAAALDG